MLEPFAAGGATNYPLGRIAADAGFEHRLGSLKRVDSHAHAVQTAAGSGSATTCCSSRPAQYPSRPLEG